MKGETVQLIKAQTLSTSQDLFYLRNTSSTSRAKCIAAFLPKNKWSKQIIREWCQLDEVSLTVLWEERSDFYQNDTSPSLNSNTSLPQRMERISCCSWRHPKRSNCCFSKAVCITTVKVNQQSAFAVRTSNSSFSTIIPVFEYWATGEQGKDDEDSLQCKMKLHKRKVCICNYLILQVCKYATFSGGRTLHQQTS